MDVSPLVLYPAGLLASLSAIAAYIWFLKPSVLISLALNLSLRQSGLSVKYIRGQKYKYCYAERGSPSANRSTLFLLHGFSASKDMYAPVVKRLPADLHIMIIDLPGHGGTTLPSPDDDVSIDQLCANVREFAELTCLTRKPFHLSGSSLGGAIATGYTMRYPGDVERLSLVCPALETPIETEFTQEVKRGECRLIPDTAHGFTHMMDSCFYDKKHVPKNKQILEGILQLRKPRNHFFTRLFETIMKHKDEDQERFKTEAKFITCPTQIVWGKQDELIHISGAKQLEELLPNVQRVDLFDKCGHSVNFERPGLFVKVLLDFRGELKTADKKAN